MPALSRNDDGTWDIVGTRRGAGLGDELHDQALVRYLTAFDPAFTRSRETSEFEFILTLLRIRGIQAAGWDPFVSTRDAIEAVRALGNRVGRRRERFAAGRHLQLWLYGHIVEASEAYEILANLVDIAAGGQFLGWRFPDEGTRPQPVGRKIESIAEQAARAGMPTVADPLNEVFDRVFRNGIFHADYSLHGGEVRLPREGRTYTHQEVMERVNRALAYFDALTILFDAHVRSYTEPVGIPVSPTFARGAAEEATVIVRTGHGVVGMKHSLSDEELAGGGIPWRVGIFTPEELALLEQDRHLALLPEREDPRLARLRRRVRSLMSR